MTLYSASILYVSALLSEPLLPFSRIYNTDQRLIESITSIQTFPQGIRSHSTTVRMGTPPDLISLTRLRLDPIARGGYIFLPQSNVSVCIEQIQLEQVP